MKSAADFIKGANVAPVSAASGPRAADVADAMPKPWDSADARIPKPMLLRADGRLDALLNYIADNTPRTSKHSFALDAVREAAERVAADLFRKNGG